MRPRDRLTGAARNKFALNAVAAVRGIASFLPRPVRNEILLRAHVTRHRDVPFPRLCHVQVFIRRFDLA
jgi:hypothetical protein